ncbi:MAG: BatD family protein, partial [Acidobacteriota bacterium]
SLGTARIYAGSVVIDGDRLTLSERTVEVVESPPERAASRRSDRFSRGRDPFRDFDRLFDRNRRRQPRERPAPRLFLEAEVEPKRPVVGQQVVYRLYLYFDVNVRNATPSELPSFKGFWTRVIPQPERTTQERTVRDGREIYRAILLERALFPRRAGTLEIEPVEATMTALVSDSSPFGSLMPRMRDIESTSNGVTVDVQPLPDPAPDGFDGLVGQLKVSLDIDRRELEVGEAATLSLELSGRGHLQSVPAPELGDIEGFQVMPPQQQSEENLRGDLVEGRRLWKWVLVPKRPGVHVVPGIDLPFYDPRRREYRVASTESVELTVRGASRVVDGAQDVKLHPVRSTVLPSPSSGSFFSSAWRNGLVALPLLLGLLVVALRGRGGGAGRAEGKRRLKQVLAAAGGEDKPRQAAALVEDAWREYLEERWGVARGTPTPQWAEALAKAGAPDDAAAELVQLADDLHYLRYAPKLSSTDGMRDEMIARSKRLARSL